MMSELELQISRLMEIKDESGSVNGDLRDHLIELYQKVGVGLLKRQIVYDEQLTKQEQEWRATCDRLIEDHQEIKETSNIPILIFLEERMEESTSKTIKRLENQLKELKSDHYSLVRENKEQSEKLNKEMENGIKTHYTKNIILSYLTTSDTSVHQNLVKVIIQALKFNEEETEKIMQFQEENNRSAISKVYLTLLILLNRLLEAFFDYIEIKNLS